MKKQINEGEPISLARARCIAKEILSFDEYWERYGELHASFCGGDIKQFAKEIWFGAINHTTINENPKHDSITESKNIKGGIKGAPKTPPPKKVGQG